MKYFFYALGLISLAFFITNLNQTTFANEEGNKTEPIVIATHEEDITGDGVKETIKLKGVLLSEDSGFFHRVWADITSEHDKEWKISYESGYDPTLTFNDLNHDKVTELIYRSAADDGELNHSHIHTLKNEKVTEIPLPKQRHVQGNFKDNFKVEVSISPNTKPNVVSVEDRTNDYIQLGIYDEQGDLQKPTSATIEPIASVEPQLISKSKGMGLKSYQPITGASEADELGTIETLWYYEDKDWIILKTEWIPAK